LVACTGGVLRWPVRPAPSEPGGYRLDPPQRLSNIVVNSMAVSRDGRLLALGSRTVGPPGPFAGAWVRHADRPANPDALDWGHDTWLAAVSPDGRWVVTAHHSLPRLQVWDVATGRLARQLPGTGGWFACFSPDGRWLAT